MIYLFRIRICYAIPQFLAIVAFSVSFAARKGCEDQRNAQQVKEFAAHVSLLGRDNAFLKYVA